MDEERIGIINYKKHKTNWKSFSNGPKIWREKNILFPFPTFYHSRKVFDSCEYKYNIDDNYHKLKSSDFVIICKYINLGFKSNNLKLKLRYFARNK